MAQRTWHQRDSYFGSWISLHSLRSRGDQNRGVSSNETRIRRSSSYSSSCKSVARIYRVGDKYASLEAFKIGLIFSWKSIKLTEEIQEKEDILIATWEGARYPTLDAAQKRPLGPSQGTLWVEVRVVKHLYLRISCPGSLPPVFPSTLELQNSESVGQRLQV